MREQAPARVRFAPSPTGLPHVGNIRTAIFNWLWARHTGGQFVLRVEDTDRARLLPGAYEAILESLRWLGLDWDEGPEVGGPHAPYLQSERLPLYPQLAEDLIQRGAAYRCYCTPERLEALREQQRAARQPTGYDRHCRRLSGAERQRLAESRVPSVVRFAIPEAGKTSFVDLFRGEITFDNATLDDHVLLKSDGWPTYQWASVVDDHLMRITHVLRGEEWISSTPRHVLEYRAMGWELPRIGHFPLILGKDRTKLSKRHGATDVLTYRELGYLPEALFNFLVLLGWSKDDKTEILSCEEVIRSFDLGGVGVNPAIFDPDKLDWMNGYYIRQLDPDELARRVAPFLQRAGLLPADPLSADRWEYLRRIVPLIQERIKRLTEAVEYTDFFFRSTMEYESALLVPKGLTPLATREALTAAHRRLASSPAFDEQTLEGALRDLASELGLKT
ncbi:MAG: glutamate--tRNA ligase, partial [Chloroflexi bacterium]|nr:glutamate--tRNA ligase [Chloroflexota bacterium]